MTTEINPLSVEWKVIDEYLDDRLQKLRVENDKPMSVEKTAFLRGQIKEVLLLRKLPGAGLKAATAKVDYSYED